MASQRSSVRDAVDAERAMLRVRDASPGNMVCADCGAPGPEYVNLTIGNFLCELCSDIHRTCSQRKIKDLYGRDLSHDDVHRMSSCGNEVANRKLVFIIVSR